MLSAEIFPLLEEAYEQTGYQIDFVSFLNTLCERGHLLLPFWLTGSYVNVNDQKGLKLATLMDAQYHRAAKQFGEAIRVNPGDPAPHNYLGMSVASTGNLSGAAEHFKGALRADPDHKEAQDNLRRVNQMLKTKGR